MKKIILILIVILAGCSASKNCLNTRHKIKQQQKECAKRIYGTKNIPRKNWGW